MSVLPLLVMAIFARELSVLAKELEIDKQIDFYGHVSLERKIELLNNMWLAVNPSPKEGWGFNGY